VSQSNYDLFDKGYQLIGPEAFESQEKLLHLCHKVIRDNTDKSLDVSRASKLFYVNILTEQNLIDYPEILYIVMKRDSYKVIHQLMGHFPRLASIGIYYTPANKHTEGSQQWHRDYDQALRQVKMFINLVDNLTLDTGALRFMPKPTSEDFARRLHKAHKYEPDLGGMYKQYYARWFETRKIPDDIAKDHFNEDEVINMLGPAGTGAYVSSGDCYHQGGRVRSIPARYTLVVAWMPCMDTVKSRGPNHPGRAIKNFEMVQAHPLFESLYAKSQLSLYHESWDDDPLLVHNYFLPDE